MAVTSALLTSEPRAFSIGPVKMEIWTYTMASGDTSVVITSKSLSRVDHAIMTGSPKQTALAISGLAATFTVADPSTGGAVGTVILIGV